MSEVSEELSLNDKESKNSVSENDAGKGGKNVKRNYCYVCKVQCTAPKNYLEHQKGKKHLKNLKLAKVEEERSQKIKHRNSQKKVLHTSFEKKSNKSKAYDSQDSTADDINKTSKKAMNTPNKIHSRYKYVSPNESRKNKVYSKYQNSKYSYSNDYDNQGFYYNSGPYSDYSYRNNMHFERAPPVSDPNYNNFTFENQHHHDFEFNTSYNNDYFSGSRHAVFKSEDNLDRNAYLSNSENPNGSYFSNPFSVETPENKGAESNSPNLGYVEKQKRCVLSIEKSSTEPEQSLRGNFTNDNLLATSPVDTDKNLASTSRAAERHFSESSIESDTNKRIRSRRSRSLSSCENASTEKRSKDRSENQSVDLENASEEQRIKEWTDSLLDSNGKKISRLLHPSNYKEKAAVNHLITKFSKEKRKEYTRIIRSNSLGPADMNENETEDSSKAADSENVDSDDIAIILDTSEKASRLEPSDDSTSTVKKSKKNSEKCKNSRQDLNNPDIDVSDGISSVSKKKSFKEDRKNKDGNIDSPSRKEKTSSYMDTKKTGKRKSSGAESGKKGKKQKLYTPQESLEKDSNSNVSEITDFSRAISTREDLSNPTDALLTENSSNPSDSLKGTTIEDSSNPSDILKINPVSSNALPVKEELLDYSEVIPVSSATTESYTMPNEAPQFDSDITVETLMQLFASGSVKVKVEFNDPVMDAIKEISPDELMSACSNQQFLNKESDSLQSSREKSAPIEPTVENRDSATDANSLPSADSLDTTLPTMFDSNESVENSVDQNLPSSSNDVDMNVNNCSSKAADLNLLHDSHSKLPSHVNKLIKQLQEISSQEERVKIGLVETKSKINELNYVLEEWKRKKKKLHDEEEDLRKQRNEIIKSLQNVVKIGDDGDNTETSLTTDEITNQSNMQKSNDGIEVENSFKNTHNYSTSSPAKQKKQKKNKATKSPESEEITILPTPTKPEPPEIIIFDEDERTAVSQGNAGNEIFANVMSSNESSSFFNMKSITAHSTVVNCIVVFEDFIYTCSNDTTAKRFSLKDTSQSVTYHHAAKNVLEIVVEKVQNEALVLTACSSRVISLFIASSGTKIKTFFPLSPVMSVCKGWGKFYVGLANGTVNVYNWKYEEREVVKTESPASRIDTAYQGRLHVLVILSSDGNIAIRDAETGLLIRYIKICVKPPSWMTVYNDLIILNSSDRKLILIDIMSGRVEKRLYLNCQTTGLAVYEDHIFTISYSGVINCFNKDNICDRKLYYGAGKNCLTCVYVYQDWVFTGNRKGNISLFQFDPETAIACEFGKCDGMYGLKEDLEYHLEKDHLLKKKNLSKCYWRGCSYLFPRVEDIDEKMAHVKTHVYE